MLLAVLAVLAVLTRRISIKDMFIYIVKKLGQFHETQIFFCCNAKDFVVVLHYILQYSLEKKTQRCLLKSCLKISFSLYNN